MVQRDVPFRIPGSLAGLEGDSPTVADVKHPRRTQSLVQPLGKFPEDPLFIEERDHLWWSVELCALLRKGQEFFEKQSDGARVETEMSNTIVGQTRAAEPVRFMSRDHERGHQRCLDSEAS
jgi:hypothetical protein